MCGIAGFCNYEADLTEQYERNRALLAEMHNVLNHRGPDGSGEYLEPHIGLSHARLSIRDLTHGTQPMVRILENCAYSIVYNGELYNAEEIKRDLLEAGYTFETAADTEVLLYACIHYGTKAAELLNGIYAFAFWDGEHLLLCRDRLGVKPLFYALAEDNLIFGSEPKALFCHPAFPPAVDDDSFRELLGMGPARTPGCGLFKGLHEVEPGCMVIYSRDGLQKHRYWALASAEHSDSYEDTVQQVRFLVTDAVRRQMVSDVPVCSFLSGGIDSSIVTALASNLLQASGGQMNTFSFDFRDNDLYYQQNDFQPERDRPFVEQMVAQYPVNHTFLECDEEHLFDYLIPSVDARDMPGMADVDASLLYFCRLVKDKNKVTLTGECADEIFGGYPWFFRHELLEANTFPWSRDTTPRTALLSDEVRQSLRLAEYSADRYADSLRAVPRLPGEALPDARRREITHLNIRWFMQTLLDRMDRTSMASGLEARVPFADHRIVEYLFNVPWSMKSRNGIAKSLLRDAFAGLLPPSLMTRK
ncbi:MAG: asparagine synthase (glutamine-hydrolyzing), partial [Oscillospiraceae bacterium]|nr:asparagine synthase (glutamine-hydrolyzing) [Oscillospiraceae bacterium]